jgi:hypothetical protein
MNKNRESLAINVKKMISEPAKMIRFSRNLFFLLAGIWSLFAFFNFGKILIMSSESVSASWIILAMMLVNAGLLFWMGISVSRRQKFGYVVGLLYSALSILLTVTDEFGIFDGLVLVLYLLLLMSLMTVRGVLFSGHESDAAGK